MLVRIGDALETVSISQTEFANSVKSGLLNDLDNLKDGLKEYDRLKKKLENRRLDFDAKHNKYQKSKKDDSAQEVQVAHEKYEETLADMERLMKSMKLREVNIRSVFFYVASAHAIIDRICQATVTLLFPRNRHVDGTCW